MMDTGGNKFGRGPRELTGALDLVNRYKLLPHHDFFCKKSHPVSVLETHYLSNVVGDTDIRKGEGMQLNQLVQNSTSRDTYARIQPFKLDVLGEAFRLRESASVNLPSSEKGIPTLAVKKSKSESKDEGKQKKDKGKDRETAKEHKKHKHQNKEKEKEHRKDKSNKKKKRDGVEDTNGIKKHKRSKVEAQELKDI